MGTGYVEEETRSPPRLELAKVSSNIGSPMSYQEMLESLHGLISEKLRKAATSLRVRELASLLAGPKTLIGLDRTNNEAAAMSKWKSAGLPRLYEGL